MAASPSVAGGIDTNPSLDNATKDVLTGIVGGFTSTPVVQVSGGLTTVSGIDTAGNSTNIFIPSPTSIAPIIIGSGLIDSGGPVVLVAPPPALTNVNPNISSVAVADLFTAIFDNVVSPTLFAAAITNAVNIVLPKSSGAKIQAVTLGETSSQAGTTGEIKVIGNAGTEKNLMAIDVGGVSGNKFVALENVESAIIVGDGSVRVSGNTSSTIAGDNANQVIVGGGGNDTLVGGGGNDTLNGGAGNDTYGLTGGAGSTVRIEGFEAGKDKIAFKAAGITDFASLVSAVSRVEYTGGNIVATFKDGSVVTLVGVTPDKLVAGLFDYTI